MTSPRNGCCQARRKSGRTPRTTRQRGDYRNRLLTRCLQAVTNLPGKTAPSLQENVNASHVGALLGLRRFFVPFQGATMYKHILVAVDDSETSKKALDEAIALAKQHGATLEIAHAVDESVLQSLSSHGVALVDARKMRDALADGGKATLDEAVRTAERAGLQPRRRFLAAEDLHAADQIAKAVTD